MNLAQAMLAGRSLEEFINEKTRARGQKQDAQGEDYH
jgi:hypothetical protein